MDEFNERLTQPLREVWAEYQVGHATLLDLSRVAEQVLAHLDRTHAPLLEMLRTAESSLESVWWGSLDEEDRKQAAERYYGPMLSYLEAH